MCFGRAIAAAGLVVAGLLILLLAIFFASAVPWVLPAGPWKLMKTAPCTTLAADTSTVPLCGSPLTGFHTSAPIDALSTEIGAKGSVTVRVSALQRSSVGRQSRIVTTAPYFEVSIGVSTRGTFTLAVT
jgi:hypothetical protein